MSRPFVGSPVSDDTVQKLANAYRRAAHKVEGLPLYNPTLAVEAVGFRQHEGRQVGVIVTPWFMNLTVVPTLEDRAVWVNGGNVRLAFPSGSYDLMVSEFPETGLVGTCSLFPTMSGFTDHAAAQLAAKAALDALFEPERPPPAPTVTRRRLLGG
jgi:[NiFe] hydrogenase assembly HybE family chaperone